LLLSVTHAAKPYQKQELLSERTLLGPALKANFVQRSIVGMA
jgi:hypothetical protein